MKSTYRITALVAFVSIAVSCGLAVDNSSEDRSFDPMGSYAQAKKAAGSYTTGLTAISLAATQKAHAQAKSNTNAFTWIWTLVGQDGMFVDVEVTPSGAKVLNHERRMIMANQATFEPSKVSVTSGDVLAIAAQQKPGLPTNLYLGARILDSGASELRWSVGYSSGELSIDGDTGDIAR